MELSNMGKVALTTNVQRKLSTINCKNKKTTCLKINCLICMGRVCFCCYNRRTRTIIFTTLVVQISFFYFVHLLQVRVQSRGQGVQSPREKSQKCGVSSQYWSGSPSNHKSTKPAFNLGLIGTPAKRHLNVFHWRADDGPILVVFGSTH